MSNLVPELLHFMSHLDIIYILCLCLCTHGFICYISLTSNVSRYLPASLHLPAQGQVRHVFITLCTFSTRYVILALFDIEICICGLTLFGYFPNLSFKSRTRECNIVCFSHGNFLFGGWSRLLFHMSGRLGFHRKRPPTTSSFVFVAHSRLPRPRPPSPFLRRRRIATRSLHLLASRSMSYGATESVY